MGKNRFYGSYGSYGSLYYAEKFSIFCHKGTQRTQRQEFILFVFFVVSVLFCGKFIFGCGSAGLGLSRLCDGGTS